jgi:hypothetical protein
MVLANLQEGRQQATWKIIVLCVIAKESLKNSASNKVLK